MEWETELWFSLRVLVAAILGALIGLEREIRGHDAGIRTYAAVTLGSCAFAIVSQASGASGDAPHQPIGGGMQDQPHLVCVGRSA